MDNTFTGRFVSRDGVPMGNSMGMNSMTYNRDYSNGMGDMSRRYDGGYSGHSVNDRMIASLEKEMDHAETEYERKQIRDEIEHLKKNR